MNHSSLALDITPLISETSSEPGSGNGSCLLTIINQKPSDMEALFFRTPFRKGVGPCIRQGNV
jgi:hypothetical protein